jgi:hypothetical protein
MRTIAIATAALLASATGALAAPAAVSVSVAPELQAKAEKELGVRDVDQLADQLRTSVEKRLARSGAYDGARIELVLTDVKPNRPTFEQLGRQPGLSFESFGIGGAAIAGQAVAANGAVTPIHFHYYESDIRQSRNLSTWADAEWAIDRFAHEFARGERLASR